MSVMMTACSPKVTTTILKDYGPADYDDEIAVVGLEDPAPDGAEMLGEIRIGDSGFSTKCTYEDVIDQAKLEARKVGGNVIKITEHKLPSAFGSSCHRIQAQILRVADLSVIQQEPDNDFIPDVNYAIINVYRYGGPGALINYDLYLGDTVICRVRNNFKTSVQVKKMGLNTIWAKTESKAEVPVDIEPGREYYVRCGIRMGAFVGRPSVELVDRKTGKSEFESFNAKNQ